MSSYWVRIIVEGWDGDDDNENGDERNNIPNLMAAISKQNNQLRLWENDETFKGYTLKNKSRLKLQWVRSKIRWKRKKPRKDIR